jgi:hypothetical protein
VAVTAVLDAVAGHLRSAMPQPPADIGVVEPSGAADLPSVVLALSQVESPLTAVGRMPSAVRTGALQVRTTVDLADPVLRIDGEEIRLLSDDRRTLQLPHGGIIRADGTADRPFAQPDLQVALGATTFAVVDAAPAADQLAVDPATGILTFGAPLAATGTLQLGYFVGTWEERVERYRGLLSATVAAENAADAARLGDDVVSALSAPLPVATGLRTMDPIDIGPVAAVAADGPAGRRRPLTFRFEAELIFPLIRTSGGPIAEVDASAIVFDVNGEPTTNTFVVRKR